MTTFRKYLLFSLIIAIFNAIVLLVFFVPRFNHTDTQQYISTIKHVLGDSASELFPYRILKPLPILIGAALSPILGVKNVLIAQNLVFYFLSVWLVFILVNLLYRNEKQAFYGTVLYATAYPMLAYGLASLTDLPGWFFFLLSVLLSLNFFKNPRFKITALSGLAAGFGMLFKENVAAAPIFFASLVFIATKLPFRDKLKYILTFGLAFLLFPIINTIVSYNLYSYSYLDAFRAGGLHPKGASGFYIVSFPQIVVEIGRVLLIGWLFVFWGALKELALKNRERAKILLALIPPSLSVFLWCYPHNRMIFIAFPLLIPLASLGLLRSYKNYKNNVLAEAGLLSVYVLVNYLILDFLLKYGESFQPYLHYG